MEIRPDDPLFVVLEDCGEQSLADWLTVGDGWKIRQADPALYVEVVRSLVKQMMQGLRYIVDVSHLDGSWAEEVVPPEWEDVKVSELLAKYGRLSESDPLPQSSEAATGLRGSSRSKFEPLPKRNFGKQKPGVVFMHHDIKPKNVVLQRVIIMDHDHSVPIEGATVPAGMVSGDELPYSTDDLVDLTNISGEDYRPGEALVVVKGKQVTAVQDEAALHRGLSERALKDATQPDLQKRPAGGRVRPRKLVRYIARFVDFGSAEAVTFEASQRYMVSTAVFAPPEYQEHEVAFEFDWYNTFDSYQIGASLDMLLTGSPPLRKLILAQEMDDEKMDDVGAACYVNVGSVDEGGHALGCAAKTLAITATDGSDASVHAKLTRFEGFSGSRAEMSRRRRLAQRRMAKAQQKAGGQQLTPPPRETPDWLHENPQHRARFEAEATRRGLAYSAWLRKPGEWPDLLRPVDENQTVQDFAVVTSLISDRTYLSVLDVFDAQGAWPLLLQMLSFDAEMRATPQAVLEYDWMRTAPAPWVNADGVLRDGLPGSGAEVNHKRRPELTRAWEEKQATEAAARSAQLVGGADGPPDENIATLMKTDARDELEKGLPSRKNVVKKLTGLEGNSEDELVA